MILAACYFGFFTLLLTVIPITATQLGGSSVVAGISLALFSGIGIVADGQVGRVVRRWGIRYVLIGGVVVAALGMTMLFLAVNLVMLFIASVITGIATAFLVNPILGGMATNAGEQQIRAQAENAMAQRGGALISALFLNGILKEGGGGRVIVVVLVALLLVLGSAGFMLDKSPKPPPPVAGPVPATHPDRMVTLVKSSRGLRSGLLVNLTLPLLIIFGSSFFPLILVRLEHAELLVTCLVSRELVALGAALVARRFRERRYLHLVWRTAIVLGVAGIVGAVMSSSPLVTVLLFSLHGAAISLGIMTLNVRIYDSTTPKNRMLGFGLASIVGRVANLVFPILLGYAFGISTIGILLVFAGLMLVVMLFQWVPELLHSRKSESRLVVG